MIEQLQYWDEQILIFFNHFGNQNFDAFWLFFTNQKNWILLYLVLAGLFLYFLGIKKGLMALVLLAVSLGICNETTDFLKMYFHRLRPSANPELTDKIRDLLHPQNYSFISGHSSNSTLFVWFSIFLLQKYTKYIYLLIFWWLLFMYSRIYVGVHYPSDIIAGIIWGGVLLFVLKTIWKKAETRL